MSKDGGLSPLERTSSLKDALGAVSSSLAQEGAASNPADYDFEEGDLPPEDEEEEDEPEEDATGDEGPQSDDEATSLPFTLEDSNPAVTKETVTLGALIESPFAGRPPVIRFAYPGLGVELTPLPKKSTANLKWKNQSTTPNVVKKLVANSGFKPTSTSAWIGTWGKHMKAEQFRELTEDQKINHFPASFCIGRKDNLARTIMKMQAIYGKKHFDFIPETYILPNDLALLRRAFEAAGPKGIWILKPSASARGNGIRVVSQFAQVAKKKNVIVSKYIADPFLVNGTKFDLRVYAYVSSYDPLRVYICPDGLARFATQKYSTNRAKLKNRFMHLTNYSVNKNNTEFQENTESEACHGHKWGMKALLGYLKSQGINTDLVWEQICEIVVKTLVSAEASINSAVKGNCKNKYMCHELFGFDIMLDSNLRAWLIEVNISPSLHSTSKLDIDIKGGLLQDLFNIAGFIQPDAPNQTHGFSDRERSGLSQNERQKHAYFVQNYDSLVASGKISSILDELTDDDVLMLMECEEEFLRRGEMIRLFPSASSCDYFKFTESKRYYNILLNQWCQRYDNAPTRGIQFLQGIAADALERSRLPKAKQQPPAAPPLPGSFASPLQRFRSPKKPIGRHSLPTMPLSTLPSSPSSTSLVEKAGAAAAKTQSAHETTKAPPKPKPPQRAFSAIARVPASSRFVTEPGSGADSWETVSSSDESLSSSPRRPIKPPSEPRARSPLAKRGSSATARVSVVPKPLAPIKTFAPSLDL